MTKNEEVAALRAKNEALAAELGRAQMAIIAVKHPDEVGAKLPMYGTVGDFEYIEAYTDFLQTRVQRMTWMAGKLGAEAQDINLALSRTTDILATHVSSAKHNTKVAKENDADS